MKIIAYLPDEEGLYIVSAPKQNGLEMGRVLDKGQNKLFPALPVQSLAARETWVKYTGDQSILPDLLKGIQDIKGN